jgi:uncharacterized protein (DUF1015 family)
MSPPYDIISNKMQDELYEKHPYNFIRLTLGKQYENDTDTENRYNRAKIFYLDWMEQEILIRSEKPSLYPYRITYHLDDGIKKEMKGFFTLLKLDKDYQKVKAHERTLSKPKADRLNLMRACNSNLEPIQLLYIDPDDSIQDKIDSVIKNNDPFIRVKGYDQFTHEIWDLSDKSVISQIQEILDDDILFIADGHHRYQTAINYAEEKATKTGNSSPNAPFNYRMVILVNMYDKGLQILPTHRLIHLPSDKNEEDTIRLMQAYFHIETYPINEKDYTSKLLNQIKTKIKKPGKHSFAWCFRNRYYIFTLKDMEIMKKIAPEKSDTWRTLDVSILHKILLEKGLRITQDTLEDYVKYTRDDNEAIDFIKQETFDSSIIMNATKIKELKAIADGGEHMPQKSTYFLPKMLSGLVLYQMDN